VFEFWSRSGVRAPSTAMRRALEVDGLPAGIDQSSTLSTVELRGKYAGRGVTYFRVFEATRIAESGVSVRAYGDLDAYPTFVLRAGRIEKDGSIVITARSAGLDAPVPQRQTTDRAGHGDDEHIVFRPENG
jgi:hypothetical protein